jgi:streptogramin lyase
MSTTFSATTFVSSGINNPYSLAFDKNGNLFSPNYFNDTISKITPDGSVSTFVSSGIDNPSGLAFDKKGNLYCTNWQSNTISKITPDGSVSTFVSSGLNRPNGLAFDKKGDLYCANTNDNTILKITPGGTVSTFVNSGLNRPYGLAFDKNGNLFCGNRIGNTIVRIAAPSGTVSTFATGITNLQPLAVDKNNNLYTGNESGKLFRISSTGVVQELTIIGATLNDVEGLAFDHKRNLFASSRVNGVIIKIALGVPSEFLAIATFSSKEEEVVIVDILEELKVFLESLSQKDINNDTLQSLILKYQNSREALLLLEKKFGVSIVG